MQPFAPLHRLFQKYKKFMLSAQQFILLHIVYIVGIGLTAVIAKLVGKHFMLNKVHNTSWVPHNQKGDSSRMF